MRSLIVTWDNRNELRRGPRKQYNGWNRRCRWYTATGAMYDSPTDIRINYEDEEGSVNIYYKDEADKAKRDWDAFKAGTLTVAKLRAIHYSGKDS